MKFARQIRTAIRRRIVRISPQFDRRVGFNDISVFPREQRTVKSNVIQFYSSVHNIGNYTPILGIHEMLNHVPDTWNMHRTPVDFEYINEHYSAAIIGGAGLLHKVFTPCWSNMVEYLTIPTIIWGVGGCFIDTDYNSVVDRRLVRRVTEHADLVNVRDTVTAEFYGLKDAYIAPCPTLAWAKSFKPAEMQDGILYASHTDLVPEENAKRIHNVILQCTDKSRYTDNIQRMRFGLYDIIYDKYLKSRIVVSTRLHGAIIATGLGIPYIALAWDEKIRAFQKEWGGGKVAGSLEELREMLLDRDATFSDARPHLLSNVESFGVKASNWLEERLGQSFNNFDAG